jgi:hypothetical protein
MSGTEEFVVRHVASRKKMYVKIVSLSAVRFKPKATKAGGAISSSCHENWHDGKTPEHHEHCRA